MSIPKRPRTCRVCKTVFQPSRCMQQVCSPACAIEKAKAVRAKAERIASLEDRKVIKAKLDKLKTARDWTKEAQIAFNAYIRERDKEKACISCGTLPGSDYVGGCFDAGHFRSRGSAPHLRFDPDNTHGQCKRCNRYLSGNVSGYRAGLVARIGLAHVEKLEADQTPRKYSIDELKAIKAKYTAMTKELKNG